MNFYEAQGKMKSFLTGDIARETLELAEDEYLNGNLDDIEDYFKEEDHLGVVSRDIPPGEDIKWMCGDCGATDWTPNMRRCSECKD